jgi:hypothetical protein
MRMRAGGADAHKNGETTRAAERKTRNAREGEGTGGTIHIKTPGNERTAQYANKEKQRNSQRHCAMGRRGATRAQQSHTQTHTRTHSLRSVLKSQKLSDEPVRTHHRRKEFCTRRIMCAVRRGQTAMRSAAAPLSLSFGALHVVRRRRLRACSARHSPICHCS